MKTTHTLNQWQTDAILNELLAPSNITRRGIPLVGLTRIISLSYAGMQIYFLSLFLLLNVIHNTVKKRDENAEVM
jgi:hypothetical protein